ncbi:MAG: DUF2934 domain-containing protein [Candidatus Omnitrophica bacterium]|nr:DUF2934 domain-containing protein [Candidatus Omnitrophota bacterium]
MANAKSTAKPTTPSTAKPRVAKQKSIIASNVSSFVNQATYNQRVQEKAYELYLQRGGAPGNELNDWFEAEKIVASKVTSQSK